MSQNVSQISSQNAWPARISIIGAAGMVGSSVAAQLVTQGIGQELYLQDRRDNLVEAHRIDLSDAQAVLGIARPRVLSGPPPEPVDLVIVAASLPETPDGDRRAFLANNAQLLDSLAEQIHREAGDQGGGQAGDQAVVLLLTNPVDILADWLARTHGFAPGRLIGYALNDSARLRRAIAQELGTEVTSVDAMVLGEHGKGQVPIFSTVRVDGEPVEWPDGAIDRIRADVDGWFERWSQLKPGRSSGWATGAGVMHLIRSLAAGEAVVTTASTAGLDALPETFMAVPTRLNTDPNTPHVRAELPAVTDDELAQLQSAGESIRRSSLALD
ncbi:malate dehydrogenase [Citricoccus sp. GCM10030269]|uniref:malate dehydrogenase n=1 Tax=Citricoccus sp. GCM10030269 TaxID=3273388 RepID=UPI00362219FD